MAQHHEVEEWVNPDAWDDQDQAQRVIDAILASGSDDEAEWVRIAGGGRYDVRTAGERAADRAEAAVATELAAYRDAERELERARADLHEALRAAMRAGHTAYRLAQVTGLHETGIGRLRRKGGSR